MRNQHFIVIDLLLVALFATIGRASHGEALSPQGIFTTAWPFMTALLVAWAVILVRQRPSVTPGAGIFVWLTTVVGGMALRHWSGAGTAVAFMIVATITLGLFLVGWRLLWTKFGGRERPSGSDGSAQQA